MCVENDVELRPGATAELMAMLASGYCDVAVPVVHEDEVGNPHFDPAPTGVRRIVTQLERHCFAMSRATALRLGALDEQMWCRTDLDLGLTLQLYGLTVGVTPNATAVFRRRQEAVDRDFYDRRWTWPGWPRPTNGCGPSGVSNPRTRPAGCGPCLRTTRTSRFRITQRRDWRVGVESTTGERLGNGGVARLGVSCHNRINSGV